MVDKRSNGPVLIQLSFYHRHGNRVYNNFYTIYGIAKQSSGGNGSKHKGTSRERPAQRLSYLKKMKNERKPLLLMLSGDTRINT
jgi:hypothetical protein